MSITLSVASATDVTKADAYAGADWATGYFDEFNRSVHVDWKPYVEWWQRPFRGAGLGTAALTEVRAFCADRGVRAIHVELRSTDRST